MNARSSIEQYLRHYAKAASPASVRQRRWALERLHLAAAVASIAGSTDPSPAAVNAIGAAALAETLRDLPVDNLLDAHAAQALVELAGRDVVIALRWPSSRASASLASQRARSAALRSLAQWMGHAPPTPSLPVPALRPALEVSRAWRALAAVLEHQSPAPGFVRFAALAATGAATALGPSAMCRLKLADLDGAVESLPRHFHGGARAALERWKSRHAVLTAAIEGSSTAAWVALAPNHRSAVHSTPPGLPMRPRGLERAWRTQASLAHETFLADIDLDLPLSLTLWARSFKR